MNTFGVKERTEHLIEPKVNTWRYVKRTNLHQLDKVASFLEKNSIKEQLKEEIFEFVEKNKLTNFFNSERLVVSPSEFLLNVESKSTTFPEVPVSP